MFSKIIAENERGLFYKGGKLKKYLEPGKHNVMGGEVEVFSAESRAIPTKCTIETLATNPLTKDHVIPVTVGDNQRALHYIGGVFRELLFPGRYVYFRGSGHKFKLVDISEPEIPSELLETAKRYIPAQIIEINVAECERGRLCFDNKYVRLLEPGRYFFWRDSKSVTCELVDTRLTQLTITGQELLTSDKVALRISLVCICRVADCERIAEIDDWRGQLHIAAQLALREYVGTKSLDEVLENKTAMSAFISEKLTAKGAEIYVDVKEAGVRDIILPGEIKSIMNTVLVAEKQAQANVITRREEVASTRSLLNTAKLMDENKTLYRLKELEYLSKICENSENLTISDISGLIAKE